jgi:hypothetical protein
MHQLERVQSGRLWRIRQQYVHGRTCGQKVRNFCSIVAISYKDSGASGFRQVGGEARILPV